MNITVKVWITEFSQRKQFIENAITINEIQKSMAAVFIKDYI